MAKNIVILTMALDIGGAETHIVELAMALKAKGENVTVFSNGGAFVPLLIENGVTHISAPMNTKLPTRMRRSKKILSRYCKTHTVDVIHSHTRITNFIAHGVCRKFHIPMVTTVHFNFKINPFNRFLSHWGQRALSVSEDLKDYVVNGYGFERDKVRVTVNGTNLNTFNQGANPALRRKYNLSDEHKVILCVSRIDHGACENVFRFLESAAEIYAACPEARILIVGDGNRFNQLRSLAAKLNSATTENFVQLAGAQTNVADFCHAADIFAGVSRSALEAMACRLPTLLIGNSGYLGVYSDKVRQACIDTNFTYRGYDYVSPHEVAEIVIKMIRTPEAFAESVEKAYRLVTERYSVAAMAEDALASYEEAANDLYPYDLMISGYYGTYNFGDDVALKAIIQNVGALHPLRRITVLSHTTKYFDADPRVTVIHRFNLRRIFPLMKKTRLFMLGGGSLLQDVTSNRSIFYYLFMLRHAQKYGCKTMVYGNGIGPILKKRHRRAILKTLAKTDCITLRDRMSYNELLQNGLPETRVHLTADETYNYDFTAALQAQTPLPEFQNKPILLVNLRAYDKLPADITADLADALDRICTEEGLYPVLMPVQFAQDFGVLRALSEALTVPHHLFRERLANDAVIRLIDRCDFLLTERLHPIIFAARMQKPFAAIAYDPKVDAAAARLNMQEYTVHLATADRRSIEDALRRLLRDRADIPARLRSAAERLHDVAHENSRLAVALLEGSR